MYIFDCYYVLQNICIYVDSYINIWEHRFVLKIGVDITIQEKHKHELARSLPENILADVLSCIPGNHIS